MLQIAIWGIAFMLLIKGLDVLHQMRIAQLSGNGGSVVLAVVTFVLAVIFAIFLIWASVEQSNSSSTPPISPYGAL
jgi:uncharacterized membrane protein